MTSFHFLRKEATSVKLVDPFGSDLTASLKALQLVNDAIKNGITKTRNGEIRAGPVLEISDWLCPSRPFPVNPATGLILVNMQYVRDNRRTRVHLERRGLPAIMMNRLPAHDNTVARRSDGSEADFTSQDFIRAQAALNHLNETQLTMINNDVLATISEVFDVDQIIGYQERSAQASGLFSWQIFRFKYSMLQCAACATWNGF